jgi:DNA/RNA-binding domain of Phe-tRNA-synthetase-like protein
VLLVVAYAEGIDNATANSELDDAISQAEKRIPADWGYQNAQSHPFIAAWRTTFRSAMNLKGADFPSSIEALAKRVLSGKKLVTINPLVRDIYLRHTRAGESFQELGAQDRTPVSAGEVCYADAEALITRYFVWRQSEEAKVTPATGDERWDWAADA